jgi:branched-chain amino acid transport system ATP-binding protein
MEEKSPRDLQMISKQTRKSLRPTSGVRRNRSLLLEVKSLRVCYGRVEALKYISIGIHKGEIVTLIGANGAGKTTTLRTISGVKDAVSGEIWCEGKRIDGMPADKIVKLGIAHIPEGRRVFADMTVMENLEVGAYLRKDKHQIPINLKELFTHFPILKVREKQLAGSLSGGEQQMLAIARALMTKPKLLLMDEPSMGLSPLLVREVGRIITEINRTGVSIILVEQNARMALKLADRAYLLEIGNIVLEDEAKKLVNNEHVRKAYLGG